MAQQTDSRWEHGDDKVQYNNYVCTSVHKYDMWMMMHA